LRIKLQKDKFNISITVVIVVYYSKLNCKYYKRIMNIIINENKIKNKGKRKKRRIQYLYYKINRHKINKCYIFYFKLALLDWKL